MMSESDKASGSSNVDDQAIFDYLDDLLSEESSDPACDQNTQEEPEPAVSSACADPNKNKEEPVKTAGSSANSSSAVKPSGPVEPEAKREMPENQSRALPFKEPDPKPTLLTTGPTLLRLEQLQQQQVKQTVKTPVVVQAKPATDIKPKVKLEQKIRQSTDTRTEQKQSLQVNLKSQTKTKIETRPEVKIAVKTQPEQKVRLDTETRTKTATQADKREGLATATSEKTKDPYSWCENGRPQWAQERFECLMFSVAGLKLAVPLVSLGTIYPIDRKFNALPGQSDWFVGILQTPNGNIKVLDTARYVMPERYSEQDRKNLSYVITLHGFSWGIACHEVFKAETLEPEVDVKWRTQRGKRPWLAGTVIKHMCALIDTAGFHEVIKTAEASLLTQPGKN